jgi:hypothetical protein
VLPPSPRPRVSDRSWRGATGLLIVQQSAYDLQFGLDINYWVHPWAGPDRTRNPPLPLSIPFIDWLCLAPQAKVAPFLGKRPGGI